MLVTSGYHKTSKPAFLMFGHHWSTRETPFKWRFAGNLNGVSLEGQLWTNLMVFGSSLSSSTIKKMAELDPSEKS